MNIRSEIAFAIGALLLNPWTLGAAAVGLFVTGYRRWKKRLTQSPKPQLVVRSCDLCDRENVPVRAVPDGFGGSLHLCLVCDCKDWDGKPWRQKAEPRPTAEDFDALD